MHVHVYACIYMYIHAYTCIYMYIHAYTCIYMYIHAYTCIYMYIHAYTCLYMYMHVYTCIYIYMYLHVYIRWTFKPGLACTAWSSFWDLFGIILGWFWNHFGLRSSLGRQVTLEAELWGHTKFRNKNKQISWSIRQKMKRWSPKLERQHHCFWKK